jgi:hypothetical protein
LLKFCRSGIFVEKGIKVKQGVGSVFNYLAAFIMLVFGVIYLLKGSFMPYHSKAIGLEWGDLDVGVQSVILALMRVVGGGYLAVSIVISLLQKKLTKYRLVWLPLLIFVVGLTVSLSTIYATILVRLNSRGRPPTILAIAGLIFLLVGYICNKRTLH